MKKIGLPALALALILTGCGAQKAPMPTSAPSPTPVPTPVSTPTATPTGEPAETLWGFPVDDTHDAFEVPTGGRLGTVLVTVELLDEEGEEGWLGSRSRFQVWNPADLSEPIQEMEAESRNVCHESDIVDANFDGFMDFGYLYARGNQPCYSHYWIWDEAAGRFLAEPTFDRISCPIFDPDTQTIEGYMRTSAASYEESFYRWEKGRLICFRKIEVTYPDDDFYQERVIYELVDGELVEVSREPWERQG